MPSVKSWLPEWRHKYATIEPISDESDDEKTSVEAFLPGTEDNSLGTEYSTLRDQERRPSRWAFYGSLVLNAVLLVSCALLAVQSLPHINTKLHDPFNNTLIKQVSMPCESRSSFGRQRYVY